MARLHPLPGSVLAIGGFCLVLGALGAHAAGPRINHVFPAGATRGSTVVLTASGEFPRWPVKVWTSHTGITLSPESDKGKFKLTVGPDVAPGTHWIRGYDEEGAAVPRPIVVGTLPEVEEIESNDSPEKPQPVAERATINGRLARNGDVDGYAVTLRKGQTLVASLQANTELGSPMDGVLQVGWLGNEGAERPVDVFVLEQNDDTVGIDPRVVLRAPRDGRYVVRVFAFPQEPNSTIGFAGGENFIYRLTVTSDGFLDHALPLAIQAGTSVDVELRGWNIPEELRRWPVAAPAGGSSIPVFHPKLAGAASLAVVGAPVVALGSARDPSPRRVMIPTILSGWLADARQEDVLVFPAAKGKKLRLRVESRTLGFDADPVLRITDSDGKRLEETDDVGSRRDPELVFSPPADGDFHAVVRDVHGHGGLRHVYRLSIEEATPGFSLSLSNDSWTVAAGKNVEIPITIDRRDGFAEKIEFYAEGLPAGITAQSVASEMSGGSAKSVKLVFQAAPSNGPSSGPIAIMGVATTGEATWRKLATYPLKALNADSSDVWLTVTPDP